MSHYNNIQTLVNLQDEYDYDALVKMLQEEDPYTLADDIAKVIGKLWLSYSIHEKKRITESLLEDAVEEQFTDTVTGDEFDE